MKGKNVFIIIITVLLFLSGTVLGVANVYRVDEVSVVAPTVSKEAQMEAGDLQKLLSEAYRGQTTFFVERETADNIVADFPYFRITKFEKVYPNVIMVEISEDAEVYAVATDETQTSYYILNASGTVLGIRDSIKNRADGNDNLFISGLTATGVKGEMLAGDTVIQPLFACLQHISGKLEGIRRNVAKVDVVRPTSETSETLFCLHMREGVKIYIDNPAQLTIEKTEKALNEYMVLSYEQKLRGTVIVSERDNVIVAEYFFEEW